MVVVTASEMNYTAQEGLKGKRPYSQERVNYQGYQGSVGCIIGT